MSVVVKALKDGALDGLPYKTGDEFEAMADVARDQVKAKNWQILGPSEQVAANVSGVTAVKPKKQKGQQQAQPASAQPRAAAQAPAPGSVSGPRTAPATRK